jgi:hypothetical protein
MSETPEFETVNGRTYLRCYCGFWIPLRDDEDKTCYVCRATWRRMRGTWMDMNTPRTQGDDTEQRP